MKPFLGIVFESNGAGTRVNPQTAVLLLDADGFEYERIDEGFNPVYFDERVSKWDWAKDMVLGATCADAFGVCERESIAWLAGNLATGFFSVADIRDFFTSLFDGGWVGAGLSLFGVIPLIGDAVKASDTISDFMRRVPAGRAADAARWIIKQDWIPDIARRSVLNLVDGAADLRARGVSDDVLIRLIGGNQNDLRHLDTVLEGASEVRTAPRFFGDLSIEDTFRTRGAAGEDFLREQLGVADTFERRGIRTNLGKRPGTKNRFPDAVTIDDLGKTIHESKVGYVRWSPRVRDQILKDIDIVNSGTDDVTRAVWHFFPSAAGDTVGADPQVLELLADNGIEFVVWLP